MLRWSIRSAFSIRDFVYARHGTPALPNPSCSATFREEQVKDLSELQN